MSDETMEFARYMLAPERSVRSLLRERDEARAEVERLREQLNVARIRNETRGWLAGGWGDRANVVPLEIRMAGPEVVAAWRDPRGVLAELSRARAEAERLRAERDDALSTVPTHALVQQNADLLREAERLRRVIGVLYMNRGHARHPLTKLLRQAFGDRLNPDEHTRPLSVGPTGERS